MPPLTPREAVYQIVEQNAKENGRRVPYNWDLLYSRFEYETNVNYRRLAHNNGSTPLDMIEEMGAMGDLLDLARTYLILRTPALPDKEKGPLQGSLID